MTTRTDDDRVNDPVVMFVLSRRTIILWVTPVVAFVLTGIVILLDGWAETSATAVVGLAATVYGALLALFIFLASTASKTRLARDLEASAETIRGSLAAPRIRQSSNELADAKREFASYIDALREKYPAIQADDIVSVGKAGDASGKGNRPVFIVTRHGHEYSVWYGGPKSAYYITDLGSKHG